MENPNDLDLSEELGDLVDLINERDYSGVIKTIRKIKYWQNKIKMVWAEIEEHNSELRRLEKLRNEYCDKLGGCKHELWDEVNKE